MAYGWISAPAPGAHLFCPHPSLTWVFSKFQGCLIGFFLLFSLSRIFPFLKYVFSGAASAFLMGSPVPWNGFIGTVWNQLYPTWDGPDLPLQRPPYQDSTMETQHTSKVLEIELPQLLKDFGVNFYPTEKFYASLSPPYMKRLSRHKICRICLDRSEELLFSLCTTNIVMITVIKT